MTYITLYEIGQVVYVPKQDDGHYRRCWGKKYVVEGVYDGNSDLMLQLKSIDGESGANMYQWRVQIASTLEGAEEL